MKKSGVYDYSNSIIKKIKESYMIGKKIINKQDLLSSISRACDIILESLKNGRKIIFAGNGGSAADAQHMAAELVGKFYLERDPLPAVALNTNSSIISAIGNDYGFDLVFSRQVMGIGSSGDTMIGITTSGNSKNIVLAFMEAKRMGINTIGFTGNSGGKVRGIVDVLINIPSDDTPRIQEFHIMVGHIICEIVERKIFPREDKELNGM